LDFVDLKTQYAALRESINARIQRVLDHGQYIMGPEVAELEAALAERTAAAHCVTAASGTEALLIALLALEVKPGDEVITTPFSFAAAAEMIALIGARPVFVDVDGDTANIDAGGIEAAVTPRTRAIIPAALYGQPADMDEINAIAARHGLPVIEDAAQSFGATYKGRQSGNLSIIGCTSFFPSKPLACYGDGGALFTGDAVLAKAMREIRVHGQQGRYRHTRIGVGGRMDTLQCAVVLAKLERFDREVQRRMEIGARYDALLASTSASPLKVRRDRTSVYAQYTVRVARRAAFEQHMKENGIPTAVHYPLSLHQQPAYAADCAGQSFPAAERLAREVISLPMHADLDPGTQQRIAAAVRSFAPAAGIGIQ
jgi:UDP-2-acetamido-2-deoxy-ribo-hexuluronate aminotransferase